MLAASLLPAALAFSSSVRHSTHATQAHLAATILSPYEGPALVGGRRSYAQLLFGIGPRPPLVVLMWSASTSFGYESFITGARELSNVGMNSVRVSNLYQASTLGKQLVKWGPKGLSYAIYELGDGDMRLLGRYPKNINANGAKIMFRRRTPRTGGADDSQLGVSGMGDDICAWKPARV